MLHRAAFLFAASCLALSLATTANAATLAAQASVAPTSSSQGSEAKSVTRNQLSTQLDNSFKTLDSNGDKTLSKAEIEAAQARSAAQVQAATAKRIETEFTRLDTNKDGQLSLAEVKAGAPAPHLAGTSEMIQKLDTNKDGKVSQDEFRATPLANFDRLDSDKDGALSAEEQRAATAPQ